MNAIVRFVQHLASFLEKKFQASSWLSDYETHNLKRYSMKEYRYYKIETHFLLEARDQQIQYFIIR